MRLPFNEAKATQAAHAQPERALREDLVAKIRTGLIKADFTPNGIKHLLKELAAAT